MSVEEISDLLKNKANPEASCNRVNTMIQTHISQVSQRISELEKLRVALIEIASKCRQERQISECGILQSLGTDA